MSDGHIRGRQSPSSAVRITEAPLEARGGLKQILDQSFTGIYLWHARRTLRSVRWVREAAVGNTQAGLTMSCMLGQGTGYIYYLAVLPSQRARGVGGVLLDDALDLLQGSGAPEILACVRADNIPSIRLLRSRNFELTGFSELVLSKGLAHAAMLWVRMFVAPGEKVYVFRPCPPAT
ncbi:MAG: GNAT family N-acetyltransferase [Spirochaetia bacterium]|jgi:ribosomal protein S18 acetylase RimI-like enzyme